MFVPQTALVKWIIWENSVGTTADTLSHTQPFPHLQQMFEFYEQEVWIYNKAVLSSHKAHINFIFPSRSQMTSRPPPHMLWHQWKKLAKPQSTAWKPTRQTRALLMIHSSWLASSRGWCVLDNALAMDSARMEPAFVTQVIACLCLQWFPAGNWRIWICLWKKQISTISKDLHNEKTEQFEE